MQSNLKIQDASRFQTRDLVEAVSLDSQITDIRPTLTF
jgi:hypothetical protein